MTSRVEGGCAVGAHVGSMSSNSQKDVGDFRELDLNDYESDRFLDGLYFDEAAHGDSSEEAMQAAREYFGASLRIF